MLSSCLHAGSTDTCLHGVFPRGASMVMVTVSNPCDLPRVWKWASLGHPTVKCAWPYDH